jgi:hypothetical protein
MNENEIMAEKAKDLLLSEDESLTMLLKTLEGDVKLIVKGLDPLIIKNQDLMDLWNKK